MHDGGGGGGDYDDVYVVSHDPSPLINLLYISKG
tara:strand:- start:251 stop:352 length:102 start_codon:yes stop_codon:yes gene_type:complete